MSSQKTIRLSDILLRDPRYLIGIETEIPSEYSKLTNVDDLVNYKNSMIFVAIGNYYFPLVFLDNQGIVYSFSENIITSYPTLKKLVQQGSVYVKDNVRPASPRLSIPGGGLRTSPERKSPRRKSPRRTSPRRTSPRAGARASPRRKSPERKSPQRTSPNRQVVRPMYSRRLISGVAEQDFEKDLNEFLDTGRGRILEIILSRDYPALEYYLSAVANYYRNRPAVIDKFIVDFIERAKNLGLLDNQLLYTIDEYYKKIGF